MANPIQHTDASKAAQDRFNQVIEGMARDKGQLHESPNNADLEQRIQAAQRYEQATAVMKQDHGQLHGSPDNAHLEDKIRKAVAGLRHPVQHSDHHAHNDHARPVVPNTHGKGEGQSK